MTDYNKGLYYDNDRCSIRDKILYRRILRDDKLSV